MKVPVLFYPTKQALCYAAVFSLQPSTSRKYNDSAGSILKGCIIFNVVKNITSV
ncbi:hypothetical protein BH11BAC5_BH11BAC5_26370 [soil metagenome]